MNPHVDFEAVVVSVGRRGCSCLFAKRQGGGIFGWSGLFGATAQLHCQHETGCDKHEACGCHPRRTI